MDLKHLSTFLAVARHLSFTRAAQELDYVQSSVTAHVKSLEADLGIPLFERLGRRVALTDAGRELRSQAQLLLNQAQQAREAVQGAGSDTRQMKGTLRIAAPESLCAHLLPPVLRALQEHYPLLRVVFGPAGRTSLITSLSEGTLDVGFLLEEHVLAPMASAERLAEESLLLVAHPGHRLLSRPRVQTADLARETLLLIEQGCAQRDIMERELAQAAIHPATVEFVSVEALKRCAAAGLGVAILPAAAVADEVARGDVIVLPWTSRPVLGVYLVLHKDRRRTAALRTLAALAREHWAPDSET
ncbi:LysR family transcriptional regulator [Streptomyces sp. N2-109]|uniref:LysR family transcriptional regulator n=1 Tax=Streptomyces gossypii TaxID=2883101 RepID=A0ABT2JXA1_9ACTN|nr:LysR family transcriptional regulator [Streptomyces gossypii]MCT2592530.1 LysR family transcriptional regulator [Streptomyces gossypii]